MKYAKLDNDNKVIQVQPYFEEGFIEVDDCVCCGMIENEGVFSLPEKSLDSIKLIMKDNIKNKWEKVINLNFEYNGNKFKCNDLTLARIGARLAYCNATTNISVAQKTFYDINREPIEFADKASFEDFCNAFIDYRNTIDQKAEVLKHQVLQSTTVEEVEAIDINSGW